MYKTVFSKKAWLTVLALGLAGFATLAIWSQVAQAQAQMDSEVDVSVRQSYGEDSGGSDITVTLTTSSSNDFVPAGNTDGNYGQYQVRTVEDMADCNEDDFSTTGTVLGTDDGDERFEVKRNRDASYTRSRVSQTFTTGTAVVADDILEIEGDAD